MPQSPCHIAEMSESEKDLIVIKAGRRPKRPRDPIQLGKLIGDILTGQAEDNTPETPPDTEGKDPAAVALGRRGGLKGGRARADSLTPEQRKQIAQDAARRRWASKPKG